MVDALPVESFIIAHRQLMYQLPLILETYSGYCLEIALAVEFNQILSYTISEVHGKNESCVIICKYKPYLSDYQPPLYVDGCLVSSSVDDHQITINIHVTSDFSGS